MPLNAAPSRPDDLLVRALGLRQLTAHILNYTVGSGIFALPAFAALTLGANAVFAYILCALIMTLVVLVFAEAGSRVSLTGGAYSYVSLGLGTFPAFVTGILLCLTDVSAAGAIAMLLTRSLTRMFGLAAPLWQAVIAVALLASLATVNVRGVRYGARLMELCTAVKLVPLLLFVAAGMFFVSPGNLRSVSLPAPRAVAAAAGVLIFAFSGIEVALLPTGEVADPSRTVPRAAIVALALVTALYLGIQTVAVGVLGPALATDRIAPLSTAAGVFAGTFGRWVLLAGASVSMFGWLTGATLAGPRALFALARDGFLPRRLMAVHHRFRTPHAAIAVYAALALGLALSGTFEQLAVLSNIAAMGVYFLCAAAVPGLRRRGIRGEAEPFRVPGGATVSILLCGAVTWLIVETITRREFIAFAVVLFFAIPAYLFAKRTGASIAAPLAAFKGEIT